MEGEREGSGGEEGVRGAWMYSQVLMHVLVNVVVPIVVHSLKY